MLPAGIPLHGLLRGGDVFVEGLRRLVGIQPRLLEKLLVVEQGERAHGGRQAVILAVALHGLDDREILLLDHLRREGVLRQGLHELGGDEVVEPAVEELDHVGPLPRRDRRGDLGLVVRIREGGVLDRDARVRGLEALDELVHGLDAGVEHVLPVLDLDRPSRFLRRAGRRRPRGRTAFP
jgi:hypothetical protein